MPTVRPRYQVTETEAVERTLDDAARLWPGESRARLLVRVIEAGAATLASGASSTVEARRTALASLAVQFDGLYPEGYLEQLREDWPR